MEPPPRARGGEGSLAPNCIVPHGHDLTSENFSIFFSHFSDLRPLQVDQTLTCNGTTVAELSQVGVSTTCSGHKSKKNPKTWNKEMTI